MLLALESLRKSFDGKPALDGVTASIDGRAVGLLGPNGAGKTTLMRVCLGLLAPDGGTCRVLDRDAVTEPLEVRRRLGFAAEGPGRIPGLSGLESVAYMGEMCGLERRHALRRAHEMLDLVGLDESRHRPVETYSTGMHQRVKIAMSLVHDPELVLLDEPTTGLDPESRDEILGLIVRLRDGGGPAVILSTHLLHDVERTCDGVLVMQAGRMRYAGTLDKLRARRTARFEVRTRGHARPLTDALQARGAAVETTRREDTIEVTLPDDADVALVWQAAASAGEVIWHLEPRSLSLEEAFMALVGESRTVAA
jgi:ABC-2 type transport system ATP-binding protein